mgnify:CR=1 FL=1
MALLATSAIIALSSSIGGYYYYYSEPTITESPTVQKIKEMKRINICPTDSLVKEFKTFDFKNLKPSEDRVLKPKYEVEDNFAKSIKEIRKRVKPEDK